MNEEEKAVLEQQRQRRNRITRMKNVVIMVVAGWMVVSFLAIIILTAQVIYLNHRIDKLTVRNDNPIQEEMTEQDNTENMDLQTESENVSADMDTEDNLAKKGNPDAAHIPIPKLDEKEHRYDVSFSGLKTAVIHQCDQFWQRMKTQMKYWTCWQNTM